MLMKGKDTKNVLSLAMALSLLHIINSKKLSASASWLSLPSDKEEQRCGFESCYEKCPPGSCCSWSGYCGTTIKHCGREYCKTQCPLPPPQPYLPGRCGMQAGGIKCPTGMCCSEDGWCGATEYYCNPQWCQSQCRNLTSSTENRYTDFFSFFAGTSSTWVLELEALSFFYFFDWFEGLLLDLDLISSKSTLVDSHARLLLMSTDGATSL